MIQSQLIDINKLKLNKGQVEGLPKNPRFIKNKRFDALKKSIEDDPEMLELRECIAFPFDNELIIIGGNMRLRACKELNIKKIPTKILPANTSIEKLKAYIIKDNVSFGEDDWDSLANEWESLELKDFGMELKFEDMTGNDIEEDKPKDKQEKKCPNCGCELT